MIISNITHYKRKSDYNNQRISVMCDECEKEYESNIFGREKGISTYGKDLCRGCKQKQQIKNGLRSIQYVNAGISSKNSGKTIDEIHGKHKADEIRKKLSEKSAGENNPNYGGSWYGDNPGTIHKGKTFAEIYGVEKATSIKKKISKKSSGINNPMFGKPPPNGSGNGWSGWYKGWYFRSLRELSYMIYVIERFNLNWKSAENKFLRIPYTDIFGKNKTYSPDFIIDNKYLIEIKPKRLQRSFNNLAKFKEATEFCTKNDLIFKVRECRKTISSDEIEKLINEGILKFTDRYQEKYKAKYKAKYKLNEG